MAAEPERNRIMTETRVPAPPDPLERIEPLPSPHPPLAKDDGDARSRVKAILDSPSYRLASEDGEFLSSDSTRGLRLQMDYLKPELLLRANKVERTIVVFGGSRICDPEEARSRLEVLRESLTDGDGNAADRRRIETAERVVANSRYYDIARAFGRIVADANAGRADGQTLIMTGGGPGIMEAANRGAFEGGAKTIGLNISLPREQSPNPYVSPDLCFHFHYFAMRKLHFLQRAMALVAFPGGFGTFDELFEVLTLGQTRKIKPIPIVLVGERFWRNAVNFDFLVEEGVIDPEDRALFWYAETAKEIWDGIQKWEGEKLKRYGPSS
jgi:uncharacterized protein (TIGR00730 family)